MVRPNATLGALGTEPRERRSPKGQNSPEAVLGNPSFSAKTKKRAYWGPFLVLMGGCGRTLRFDKLCPRQSLDAKPIGGAPWKGESGEGSAARIYPYFSAKTKKGPTKALLGFDWVGGVDENSSSRLTLIGTFSICYW